MSELKPCPFCGGKPRIDTEYDMDGFGNFHKVECSKCGASSKSHFATQGNDCPQHYQEVRDDWQMRTESTQLEQVTKERDEFASIARVLLKAAKQYVDYEHDGDPWSEDARTMGEMEINDLHNEGKLDEFIDKLNQ